MHVAALLLLALISARGYANAHAAEADSSVKEVYIWGSPPPRQRSRPDGSATCS